MSFEDAIALSSFAIAVLALVLALYAVIRANKTTSAATLISLNEAFRSAWCRFFIAQADEQKQELAELMNLLEIACAIRLEGSLSGNSAKIMSEYLNDVLGHLVDSSYASEHIPSLLLYYKIVKLSSS